MCGEEENELYRGQRDNLDVVPTSEETRAKLYALEVELNETKREQRMQEERLKQREAELAERFWPGGEQPITRPPRFEVLPNGGGRLLAIAPLTPSASIEFSVDEGDWQLYSQPFPVGGDMEVRARSVRYGWAPSAEVLIEVP